MAGDREIKEAIQHIAGTHGTDPVYLCEAEVTSVDEAARTCEAVAISGRSEVPFTGVRLMPGVADGILTVPAVGSTIIVSYSKRIKPFVLQFSEVDKWVLISGSSFIEVKDGKITLNDGTFDGLVKVGELTEKLNNLENKVNALLTAYNSHTHTGVTTGPGTSGSTASVVTGTLPLTQQADIENDTVIHGS